MNRIRCMLIVDADPLVRRQLVLELSKRGMRAREAISGKEAQVLIAQERPDGVITELELTGGTGLELLSHIRAEPDLQRMPVVVYTSQRGPAERLKALHAGADEVLIKPANPEELILRLERALQRAETSGLRKALKTRNSSMMGDLSVFSPASLLNLVSIERRTGVLFLENNGQEARIALKEGRMHSAKLTGPQAAQGADAVYRLLRWDRGNFCLTPERVEEPDTINQPTSQLLMEGLRQQDETHR